MENENETIVWTLALLLALSTAANVVTLAKLFNRG